MELNKFCDLIIQEKPYTVLIIVKSFFIGAIPVEYKYFIAIKLKKKKQRNKVRLIKISSIFFFHVICVI